MKRVLRILWIMGVIFSLAAGLAGCSVSKENRDKVRDLEFQTAPSEELPQELSKLISEKVSQPFKLTYTDDKNLYIAVGYGAQPTGVQYQHKRTLSDGKFHCSGDGADGAGKGGRSGHGAVLPLHCTADRAFRGAGYF